MFDLDALQTAEHKLRDLAPVPGLKPVLPKVVTQEAPRGCPFLHQESAA